MSKGKKTKKDFDFMVFGFSAEEFLESLRKLNLAGLSAKKSAENLGVYLLAVRQGNVGCSV